MIYIGLFTLLCMIGNVAIIHNKMLALIHKALRGLFWAFGVFYQGPMVSILLRFSLIPKVLFIPFRVFVVLGRYLQLHLF